MTASLAPLYAALRSSVLLASVHQASNPAPAVPQFQRPLRSPTPMIALLRLMPEDSSVRRCSSSVVGATSLVGW